MPDATNLLGALSIMFPLLTYRVMHGIRVLHGSRVHCVKDVSPTEAHKNISNERKNKDAILVPRFPSQTHNENKNSILHFGVSAFGNEKLMTRVVIMTYVYFSKIRKENS